jgi:hypothetical protein
MLTLVARSGRDDKRLSPSAVQDLQTDVAGQNRSIYRLSRDRKSSFFHSGFRVGGSAMMRHGFIHGQPASSP